MKERLMEVISQVPVSAQVVGLFFFYVTFGVLNNSLLKISAHAEGWKAFVGYQACGFMAGTLCALIITGLYYYIPMHIALPVALGLTVAAAQLAAGGIIFHETIQPQQWAGTVLMIAAIALICYRK